MGADGTWVGKPGSSSLYVKGSSESYQGKPSLSILFLEIFMNSLFKLTAAGALAFSCGIAAAQTWMIGDNDGFGIGIPDNGSHSFDGYNANYDGRTAAEAAATNGAQYTDTYSTTHSGYGPQPGTVATFLFTGLGSGWTHGSMWFDSADFQAGTYGAVKTTYNGILEDWAFNDGFPNTAVHYFDLSQAVIASINNSGSLTVVIDRNGSTDFYGFDYAMLSDRSGADTVVPVPAALPLFASAMGLFGLLRRRKVA